MCVRDRYYVVYSTGSDSGEWDKDNNMAWGTSPCELCCRDEHSEEVLAATAGMLVH